MFLINVLCLLDFNYHMKLNNSSLNKKSDQQIIGQIIHL